MADCTTPSSLWSTHSEQKWTVSPEFGDALLVAMRERNNTGGPLPRLPPMLQLPSPELLTTPVLSSPTKVDTAERLKMKTRVAIRDRDPHRFQVVPLCDAAKYSTNQKPPRGERQSVESVYVRGREPVRGNLHLWKKGRVNENDPAQLGLLQDYRTLDRPAILSERDRNIPAQKLYSFQISVSSGSHVASGLRLDSQPLAEQSKQPTSEQCSHVSAKTMPKHNKLHYKSTSLGNLRTKPNLDIDLKANPLPRVTSCRKRTNTLSVDRNQPERALSSQPMQRPDRHNTVKKDSIRRHAIYTQSLYVPALERSNEISAQLSEDFHPMRVVPFRSSIPVNPNKFNTLSTSCAGNVLGFNDVKSPARIRGGSLISQPSISSMYPQDEPIPIRTLNIEPTSNFHHPIIVDLLAEVEEAMQEWSTSS